MPEFFQSQFLLIPGHHSPLMTVVFQLFVYQLESDNLHLADLSCNESIKVTLGLTKLEIIRETLFLLKWLNWTARFRS